MRIADLMGLVRAMAEYYGVALLAENHSQSAYPTFVMHGHWDGDPVRFLYIKAHTDPTKAQLANINRLTGSGCTVLVWNVSTPIQEIITTMEQGARGTDTTTPPD